MDVAPFPKGSTNSSPLQSCARPHGGDVDACSTVQQVPRMFECAVPMANLHLAMMRATGGDDDAFADSTGG